MCKLLWNFFFAINNSAITNTSLNFSFPAFAQDSGFIFDKNSNSNKEYEIDNGDADIVSDDFDEIKASGDEYIMIQKIRNLTANSFEIVDKGYNFSDLLDLEILLPNAFKKEFPEFCDLLLEIQKFPFFEQKINKLRQLESQVPPTPISEHMTVYLSYIPDADHLLYYGKSRSALTRFRKYHSDLNQYKSSNSSLRYFLKICQQYKLTPNDIIKSKIFFRKIAVFKINKQNLTVNQYNTASELISDLEIDIKKFLDQKQNKFFSIINIVNVDTSFGKLRDRNTRPIDEIFEAIFHKALVNKVNELQGLETEPVDFSSLSAFNYQQLIKQLEICIPVVDMVNERYFSFLTAFTSNTRTFEKVSEAVKTDTYDKKDWTFWYATPDEIRSQKHMQKFDNCYKNSLVLESQNKDFVPSGSYGVVGPSDPSDTDMNSKRKYYRTKVDAMVALYKKKTDKTKFYNVLNFYQDLYEKCDRKRLWRDASFEEYKLKKPLSKYDLGSNLCVSLSFYGTDKKYFIVGPNFHFSKENKDPRDPENLTLYQSGWNAAHFLGYNVKKKNDTRT